MAVCTEHRAQRTARAGEALGQTEYKRMMTAATPYSRIRASGGTARARGAGLGGSCVPVWSAAFGCGSSGAVHC